MKTSRMIVGLVASAMVWPLAAGAVAAEGDAPGTALRDGGRRPLRDEDRGLRRERPRPADAAWLGIQLAPVPAALASHLQLGEAGVMVRNVFKGSPADQAGIDRFDVMVVVDGQNVEGDVEAFSRHIQSKKPGDQLKLTLYRQGQQQEVVVTLAEPPARIDERSLKYEDDPDVAHRRMFGLRGKILRPGPEGWILDDLGELPDLDIEGWIERDGRELPPPPPAGEELQESRRVDADGNVIHVRKLEDGRVEVRRYKSGTPAEEAEIKTYANMDELRGADPEAAELLSTTTQPSDESQARRRHMRERWRVPPESPREYQDALREYMNRFGRDFDRRMPPPPNAPGFRERDQGMRPGPWPERPAPARPVPQARFEVQADGSITAHVQDGPTELTMTFPDEKTFQQKAPDLYERYRSTLQRAR